MAPLDYSRLAILVGMPRSGTTWLAKILDSHPDTVYYHEPDRRVKLDVPPFAERRAQDTYGERIEDFVMSFDQRRDAAVSAKPPLFRKSYMSPLQYQLFRMSAFASRACLRAGLGVQPLYVPQPRRDGGVVSVWKSVNTVGRVGLIARVLAGSRVIFLVRHPCGQIASVRSMEEKVERRGGTPPSGDFSHIALALETDAAKKYGLTLDQMRSLSTVERLAWMWVIYNEKAITDLSGVNSAIFVRYEDVCESPEQGAQRLFDHVGLDFELQSRDFVRRSTNANDDRYFSVFKNPRESASKWANILPQGDIERIMSIAADTLPGRFALQPESAR